MQSSSQSQADTRATNEPPRLLVSWTQVAASAAAAVTAATVASLFGVAGTIIGTVLVSVVATTGSALYNASLRRTQIRLQQARSRLLQQAHAGRVNAITEPVSAPIEALPPPPVRPRPQSFWQRRTPLAVGVVAVIVVAIAAITAVELAGHKPLAAIVGPSHARGGTSIFGGGSSSPASTTSTTTSIVTVPIPGVVPTPTTTPSKSTNPTPTTAPGTTTTTTSTTVPSGTSLPVP